VDQLGLVAVLHNISTEFTDRAGVSVRLSSVKLTSRLPTDTELTLYRILQEALRNVGNVERHARARHVTVKSACRAGTRIEIRVPLPPNTTKAGGPALFARQRNQDASQL
jgi:signal transduction histidine kinase